MSEIILDSIQEDAVKQLLAKKRYCLFWDVGVGKTYAILSRLAQFNRRMKVLILAPAVVIDKMWTKEQEDDWFGVFEQHEVEMHSFEWLAWNRSEYVINKQGIRVKKVTNNNIHKLGHTVYDVIIIDEAHRLSSPAYKTKVARYVSRLTKYAEYAYALSGTPAPNGYQDLYPLLHNLGISIWKDYDYNTFLRVYFKGYELKLPHATIYKPDGLRPNMKQEFMNDITPYCMFAQKQRTWEILPPIDVFVKPTLTPLYYDALNNILTDINGRQTTTTGIIGFGRAYMLLNGFQYVLGMDGNNETIEYFENPKLIKLQSILKDEFKEQNCVLVTYNFKQDLRALTTMFQRQGIAYTDNLEVARSMKTNFVYLLQLKKGIGINLQDLTGTVIFYTYDFSYVDYDQTIGRIDRRGQERTVKIYRLIFNGTIEQNIILRAIEAKQRVDYALKTNAARRLIGKEVKNYGYPSV